MKLSLAATTILSLVVNLPSIEAQSVPGLCYDSTDKVKGESGPILDADFALIGKQKKPIRTRLERRGAPGCPCSFAQTKCTVQQNQVFDDFVVNQNITDCKDLEIDATKAIAGGVANYPIFDADYKLKICNYNAAGGSSLIEYATPDPSDVRNFLKFWKTSPTVDKMASDGNNGFTKDFKVNEEYGVNSLPIKEGRCMKETGSAKLDTSFSKYYLEASVNGKLTIPGQDSSYCYAYSYNPLDFKYNYGDGECKFTTDASCIVEGAPGSPTCEEYIKNMDEDNPTNFTAKFSWKACNNNDRDVFIQQGASNSAYNNYIANKKGKFGKVKEPLPAKIPGLQSSKSNCYEPLPVYKVINPTLKNFFQINVQGRLYNNEDGRIDYFRDKDCKSFEFQSLPVIDPSAPSATPTTSQAPSKAPTKSPAAVTPEDPCDNTCTDKAEGYQSCYGKMKYTECVNTVENGSVVIRPIQRNVAEGTECCPAENDSTRITQYNTDVFPCSKPQPDVCSVPTPVPTPGSTPPPASGPTPGPTPSPTVSMKPSGKPTVSSAPSGNPTVSSAPSGNPTLSSAPSRSSAPSGKPTVSSAPSGKPTVSSAPSGKPTVSSAPSGKPTVSSIPSAKPTVSSIPSGKPTDSAKPTAGPSISTAPSSKPTKGKGKGKGNGGTDIPTSLPMPTSSKGKGKGDGNGRTDVPTTSPEPTASGKGKSTKSESERKRRRLGSN